jgi:putative ubiquitin-RnfH superfamily antitoxin RatB of RatAB toxin-antitoxin module
MSLEYAIAVTEAWKESKLENKTELFLVRASIKMRESYLGVFSTMEKAEKFCTDNDLNVDIIEPVTLDAPIVEKLGG